MTARDLEVIIDVRDYVNRVKPARIQQAMNRLARMAKQNGLSDDCRMYVWAARFKMANTGNGLAAFTMLNNVLAREGKVVEE